MKSRNLWMVEGDKNTTFYHTFTIMRRRRNRISCLKERMGYQLNGDNDIANFIRIGFKDLFSTSYTNAIRAAQNPPFWHSCIRDKDVINLIAPVTDSEIAVDLWSLKAFKAPGSNGLHARFFQCFWLLVVGSVREEVKSIFTSRKTPKYLNKTLITLIPKCKSLSTLNNYCPINLCNTVYQIVSKIIVARIQPLSDNLVSPLQSAFVPGRKGIDNAIIVQELIHTMSKKKRRNDWMVIKIDMEKVCNRLEWSFIRDTLLLYEFPKPLISLIMSCVSSSSISILFNGRALEPFLLSRGIRQGDPFSPYLLSYVWRFQVLLSQRSAMQSCRPRSKLLKEVKLSLTCSSQTKLCFLQRRTKRIVWQ